MEYLDHLALSSINFPSLLLLSSTKRRQICSTFVKYTLTSSLLYWQSRQRNGRSAFSLQSQKQNNDDAYKYNSSAWKNKQLSSTTKPPKKTSNAKIKWCEFWRGNETLKNLDLQIKKTTRRGCPSIPQMIKLNLQMENINHKKRTGAAVKRSLNKKA